jgi:hypothetical protein
MGSNEKEKWYLKLNQEWKTHPPPQGQIKGEEREREREREKKKIQTPGHATPKQVINPCRTTEVNSLSGTEHVDTKD